MLRELQADDRAIFEYWTHALSYLPVEAFPHFVRAMRGHECEPSVWFSRVTKKQARDLLRRIERDGPLSIRQIEEEKQEKDHEWASRKPSKRVLEHLFYSGRTVIGSREGMLKNYERTERHFGWAKRPRASTLAEETNYRIDRTLEAQGLIDLDSATYLEKDLKPRIARELSRRVRNGTLAAVRIQGSKNPYYARPEILGLSETSLAPEAGKASILSPFDPLVIQRKRTKALFDFDYVLECYVPATKRKFGYFSLPVLFEDRLVARIDAKADRAKKTLLIQSWHWERNAVERKTMRPAVEEALGRFEAFQFGN
jgi:uncharacterized protein YcaQ